MGFSLLEMGLPTPESDTANEPFWENAKDERFVVAECCDCGAVMAAPVANCRRCLSTDIQWRPGTGRGVIYTFAEYHRAWRKDFEAVIPYVVAFVTLDEGPMMPLGVVTRDASSLRIGDPVRVVFQARRDGYKVPMVAVDHDVPAPA